MKKFVIAIVILSVIQFVSSCKSSRDEKSHPQIDKQSESHIQPSKDEEAISVRPTEKNWGIYQGTMSNGKHIGMYLALNENDSIYGSYFYSRHQKLIELSGIYNPKTGEYTISEYYKSKLTGLFVLKNSNGKLTGHWKKNARADKQNGIELYFVENQKSVKPTIDFTRYENKHMTFEYSTEEESEVTDELFIAKISTKTALFDYSVIGTNWHTGQVNGKLEYSNEHQADFEGEDDCQLSFNFEKGNVSIMESNCQYYRGMRAYFDNELTKKQK